MAGGVVILPTGGAHDVPTEGSRTYAIVVCVFSSLGGIFFGYDQGVTGGVLVMDSFLNDFCVDYDGNTKAACTVNSADLPDNWSTFTTLFNVLYYIGCIFGAYLGGATGINPIFTYGGQIFKDVVGDGVVSLLIFQIVNFLSTIPAMVWVDKIGRRRLLLLGAAGMVIGHLVSAIAFTAGCKGDTSKSDCSTGAGWTMIVFTAFFIFNFAISWGPICWVYPAEIFPMNVRAKAVSASSMANWCMGALMIGIPKLFPYLNINGVFFLFTALCALAYTYVYFNCPETKGLLLEDIELLFSKDAPKPSAKAPIETPKFDEA
ncbi:hypothetical protein SDRG_08754 [Saprolegnia diclina VS20]|uniref:Major facilitator superfamily (MFS) profile domain-containing protein n=1 Tax=Saprolegnia diclina (strain VS20) TaxID=1156394 RepID=T0QIT7_SAPDV|nr:hypothetical protein SDRG_08754 [Saprolegnia diclina VS20]EQC33650.1 hypothetical protein SDRG_08754 [Saprolegnia diclina VS20]|eukprot:XP_008612873.1 hypothetical protein SDRG_08754 [Saprolegnia diclina VS20]